MLHLNGLGKRFGDQWILRDLNLQVHAGECVALLGPSGCGKSTALRLIAGLERQDEGSIELDGAALDSIPAERRRIAMVFQSYALFPHLSVRENLDLGLKIRRVALAQRQQRIESVLDTVRLREMADRRPQQLSGGQRQRVALARALLRDPRVYLLDEPMSNLDAQLRDDLRPELRQLILEGTQPVLYVTHDQQEAMALANRIAVLKDGRIEQIGTPEELYKTPASQFVASFIGRPQINLLPVDQQVSIGIRPEHLRFDPEGIPCRLISREWQGASQLLLLDSPRGALRMLCNGDLCLSEPLSVSWPTSAEHRFDAGSGRRLTE